MKLHKPVLLEETIEGLNLKPGEVVIDMTAGFGGHSEEILKKIGKKGRLIVVDRDIEAINELKDRFKKYSNVEYRHTNFAQLEWKKIGNVDKILLDLGVSSPQLDRGYRGFSFNKDAELDMRMDTTQDLTAKQIVNEYFEKDLADIIYVYGEERYSRRIAKAIVEYRSTKEITSTLELAEIVENALPVKTKINPATKTFQAIRIMVNSEVENLKQTLPKAIEYLSPNGRIAVITFHSLEDRIVKQFFKGLTTVEKDYVTGSVIDSPHFKLVNKKPFKGSELDNNPRARSAKLRLVEKIN